jgi:hypothetical protein
MKIIPFLAALALVSPGLAKSPVPDLWWNTIERTPNPMFRGGHSDSDDPEVNAFLKLTEFKEWVEYEDQFVRFRYPKHQALELEVNEGDGGIEVEGGVCTTVDNGFQRAYVLKAGSATYQVLLLSPADWLDDGI